MNIVNKKSEEGRPTVKLSSLKPGEVFQFQNGESLESALQESGSGIFMVVEETKEQRVKIFPLSGSVRPLQQKDADRLVYKLQAELKVWE